MQDGGKTVMLVDDSPMIITYLQTLLNGLPGVGKIVPAHSYEEALGLLGSETPAIALLDINLPGANGIQLLRYIKDKFPSIVVIMLSNQSGEFYRARCKAAGASYFIDKSTEFDQLSQVVASFL